MRIHWISGLISFEPLSSNANKLARAAVHRLAVQNCIEHSRATFHVPDCIKQHVLSATCKTCDDGVRRGLRNAPGSVAGGDFYRENVCLGRCIEIANFDEPKLDSISCLW